MTVIEMSKNLTLRKRARREIWSDKTYYIYKRKVEIGSIKDYYYMSKHKDCSDQREFKFYQEDILATDWIVENKQ